MDGVAVGKGLCVRNGTPETPPNSTYALLPRHTVAGWLLGSRILISFCVIRIFWWSVLRFWGSHSSYAPLLCFHIDIDINADLFHLFVGCLPTLSVIGTGQRRMIKWLWIMNWKGFERNRSYHYLGHCSSIWEIEENHENLSNDTLFPGQDSNPAPPE